jgi:hypothetical protein
MKCHGDDKEKQSGHSPLKHMLHMVICCGLPMLLIGFLPVIAKFSPGAGSVVAKVAPFICPLMMIGMIFMMRSGNKKGSCCGSGNENNDNNKALELNKPVE